MDPPLSKYQFYCVPLDFLEQSHSAKNAIMIFNSSTSDLNIEHWLCILQTRISLKIFDPFGLPNTLYSPHE